MNFISQVGCSTEKAENLSSPIPTNYGLLESSQHVLFKNQKMKNACFLWKKIFHFKDLLQKGLFSPFLGKEIGHNFFSRSHTVFKFCSHAQKSTLRKIVIIIFSQKHKIFQKNPFKLCKSSKLTLKFCNISFSKVGFCVVSKN